MMYAFPVVVSIPMYNVTEYPFVLAYLQINIGYHEKVLELNGELLKVGLVRRGYRPMMGKWRSMVAAE